VNYFKGQLRHCTGSPFHQFVEDVPEYMELLTYPKPWHALTDLEKSYFGPNSTIPMHGSCDNYDYPNEPCCSSYPTSRGGGTLITSKMICECWGGKWDFIDINNFDNVGAALLTLFQMSTTEGWVTLMYDLVDTSDIHMQPIRDNRVEWIFFCIFFMLVASYLALNLFVGVVIDNFNKMKKKLDGNNMAAFLTPEQQEWIKTQDIVRRIKPSKKPVRPSQAIPGMIFDLCYHPWFEWFILYCILTNTLCMAMNYFGQEHLYGKFLDNMNLLFAAIFTLEAMVKIIALRQRYFADSWNQYDFFIVLGTNAGLIYRWVEGSNVGLTITIFRTFRIARILRLMNGTESISQLVNTLILTLPGLGNIAALLFLLFFIFAVTGIQLFAKVGYHGSYNEHANFRDFGVALLTLLRFSTGEAWNNFMFDASRKPEGCVVDPEYDPDYCGFNDHIGCLPLNGCGTLSIFPYLISFTVVISVVFINLFVGVILEGFSFSNDETGASVKPDDFMKFADHWAKFDPNASCYISIQQLEEFVQTLGPPLGFGRNMKRKELSAKISRLPLHIHPGKVVHFKDVLSALSTDAICRVPPLPLS
jgi:voltage-dependent calcium channel L type alpha-1D